MISVTEALEKLFLMNLKASLLPQLIGIKSKSCESIGSPAATLDLDKLKFNFLFFFKLFKNFFKEVIF